MSRILVDSNVYYLPQPVPAEPELIEPEWPSFWCRLRNAWWRLRLALAEVRAVLRHPRHRFAREYGALFEESDVIVPRRPAPTRPARIIDFDLARRRLRPQGSA